MQKKLHRRQVQSEKRRQWQFLLSNRVRFFFIFLWPKQMLWQHEKGFYSIAGNMQSSSTRERTVRSGEERVLNGYNALEMFVCLRLLQLQRKSLVNYKVQCKFVDHMQIYVIYKDRYTVYKDRYTIYKGTKCIVDNFNYYRWESIVKIFSFP